MKKIYLAGVVDALRAVIKEKLMNNIYMTTGLLLFITGLILISPIGFILLLGLFYAMWVQNLILGVVCGALLSVPTLLGLIWAPTAWAILIRDKCIPGIVRENPTFT